MKYSNADGNDTDLFYQTFDYYNTERFHTSEGEWMLCTQDAVMAFCCEVPSVRLEEKHREA